MTVRAVEAESVLAPVVLPSHCTGGPEKTRNWSESAASSYTVSSSLPSLSFLLVILTTLSLFRARAEASLLGSFNLGRTVIWTLWYCLISLYKNALMPQCPEFFTDDKVVYYIMSMTDRPLLGFKCFLPGQMPSTIWMAIVMTDSKGDTWG